MTAARAASRNRTVRRVGATAALAAAKRVEPIARERYGTWRDRRVDRDMAMRLARQIGGRYSEDTIIEGGPHFVVWQRRRPRSTRSRTSPTSPRGRSWRPSTRG